MDMYIQAIHTLSELKHRSFTADLVQIQLTVVT